MKPLTAVVLCALSLSARAATADVVENLNQPVPLDAQFLNQDGTSVTLARYFKPDRPVVITPVYYSCPTLCSIVLKGVVTMLRETGLELGKDYEIVTYSIDPNETPAQAKAKRLEMIADLGYPADTRGWDFLVGDAENIHRVSEQLGFRYQYDAQIKQYVHAAAFMLLTPEGRISRYVYGVRFPASEVRLGLIEASGGRVGTSFDRFILTCTRYDPLAQKYRLYVWGFIRGGGMLVFVALATLLFFLWRRELRSSRSPALRPSIRP